jgi:hypothetical protein
MAANMKMTVFWDMLPCSLEEADRRYRSAYASPKRLFYGNVSQKTVISMDLASNLLIVKHSSYTLTTVLSAVSELMDCGIVCSIIVSQCSISRTPNVMNVEGSKQKRTKGCSPPWGNFYNTLVWRVLATVRYIIWLGKSLL